ncbi:hypothetical protein AMTR_s00120p00015920 [Amborella trichopoda]|uniref:Uncharacterized protein n=1 Tax=Amborella trichopoda TaxID=13333 RepID=W1NQF3_AMBTC|nr:hypothetical protein AMTR_s00120p00015920 [Amborella trichopoda]
MLESDEEIVKEREGVDGVLLDDVEEVIVFPPLVFMPPMEESLLLLPSTLLLLPSTVAQPFMLASDAQLSAVDSEVEAKIALIDKMMFDTGMDFEVPIGVLF